MNCGVEGGILTTHPVIFHGRHFIVNFREPEGSLRAEILNPGGDAIEPFTMDACGPTTGDSTRSMLSWRAGGDLAALSGKPVR
jgi:hypothetical protein